MELKATWTTSAVVHLCISPPGPSGYAINSTSFGIRTKELIANFGY